MKKIIKNKFCYNLKTKIFFFVIYLNIIIYAQSNYFYKGYDYGSQATYNPISLILNGGFDMAQVGNKRDLSKTPFYLGHKNLMKNLADPISAINDYGWWEFIRDQVLPISVDKSNAQYWPNYTLHLIGGGMEYTAMKEWYEYHKFPYPGLLSILNLAAYHYVNEVFENGAYQGYNVDPIADIYIFDLGGVILFSFDNINQFFSETLNLADWSSQASFSLKKFGEIHNNGQFFSIKWKLPFSDNWHLFYFFGTNGVGGLSYKKNDGDAISFGVGLKASELIDVDEKKNKKTLDFVWNVGLFYDRNNSLLASLSLTRKTDYAMNLNIYPGVFKIGDFSPGIWAAYNTDGKYIFGITARWVPFGIAYSFK